MAEINIVPVRLRLEYNKQEGNYITKLKPCSKIEDIYVIHQHDRDEGNKWYYQPGFTIESTEYSSAEIEQFKLYLSAKDQQDRVEMTSAQYNGKIIWFKEPERRKDGELRGGDYQEGTVVSAGVCSIQCEYNGKTVKTVKFDVLPSAISSDDYREMLEDILSMNKELVLNSLSSVGIGKIVSDLEKIREQLEKLYYCLGKINSNPKAVLKKHYVKKNANQIKKFDTRTLAEMLSKGDGARINSVEHIADYNIYENRIIKQFLLYLNEHLLQRETIEKTINSEDELEDESRYIEDKLKLSYGENFTIDKVTTTEGKIEELKKMSLISAEKCSNAQIQRTTFSIQKDNFRFIQNNSEIYFWTGYKLDKHWLRIQMDPKENKHWLVLAMVMKASCKNEQLSLGISGNPILKNNVFVISAEDIVSVNEKSTWSESQEELLESYVEKLYLLFSMNKNKYQETEFIQLGKSLIKEQYWYYCSLKKQFEIKKDQQIQKETNRENLKAIEFLVQKMLYLPMMKQIKVQQKERLKSTPVFSKDKNYRKAYQIIKEFRTDYCELMAEFDTSYYGVKPTCYIYEVWILHRILHKLRELGFDFVEKSERDKLRQGNPSGKSFRLEKELGKEKVSATLFYECELNTVYQQIDIQSRNINGGFKKPDYCLWIKYPKEIQPKDGEKKRLFIFDAKYKSGEDAIFHQVNNTAYEKYYKKIEESLLEKSLLGGSYILHPVSQMCQGDRYKKTKFLSDLLDEQENKQVVNHGLGAVLSLPSAPVEFERLLKLIFEYHMNLWDDCCWHCGSQNLHITKKYTESGSEKYEYICNDCDEIWLKTHCRDCRHHLIKHYKSKENIDYNYHKLKDDDYNYHKVSGGGMFFDCPVCGSSSNGK